MNITNLYNKFRTYKFNGNEIDKYVIERIFIEALNTNKVSEWNIDVLNNKILNYMLNIFISNTYIT